MTLSKEKQKECGVPPMSEKEFTKQVLNLAKFMGWRTAHFRPAQAQSGRWLTPVQGDGKGFPDLLMVKGDQVIAAELKVGRNNLTPEQGDWLRDLRGAGVEAHTWRPADWPRIVQTLRGDEE